jgi:hypothetical protein
LKDFSVGGITGFTISSRDEGFPEETDHLLLAFRGFELPEWKYITHEYEILSLEGEQEPHIVWDTVYNVKVNFRSIAEYDTWVIQAAILLFNSDGRIVGVCHDENPETRSDRVIPGDVGEIEVRCLFVYGVVDHFEITVEGSQAPES